MSMFGNDTYEIDHYIKRLKGIFGKKLEDGVGVVVFPPEKKIEIHKVSPNGSPLQTCLASVWREREDPLVTYD